MSAVADRLSAALDGRYRVERELGQGGMATVYLAHDLKHDRKVAIKVLKQELAAVLGAERFVQEIKTTAALSHPHILPLFDSGTADGYLYYVMPYVEGETLRSKLDRETQLGIDEAVRITRDVADALHYAHSRGVIHRDIKPENILLANGRPLVADFGIALAVSAAAGGRMTETGLSLGTPHYMSPEQATAEKEISARSDIYSLASVLYEMLTGDPPHTGSSAQQIIMRIVTDVARPVTELRKAVPPNVAAALAQALEKLPADRFTSANAFGEALANPAFQGRATTAMVSATSQHAGTWNRTSIGMTIVAAASLLLAASTFWRASGRADESASVRFALTDDPGLRLQTQATAAFAVSPDGRTVVFSARDANNRSALWVRTLDDPTPRRLDGTDGAAHPAISPDGEWVAFLVSAQRVSKVRLAGSTVTELAVLPSFSRSLVWASNDVILCEMNAPPGPLVRVPAAGGRAEVAIALDSAVQETRHGRIAALPKEGMVLFSSATADGATDIVLYSFRNGRRARLGIGSATPLAVVDRLLVFVQSNALMAVPLDVSGMRITGRPTRLTQTFASYGTGSAVAVSPGGTLVYEPPGTGTLSQVVLIDQDGQTTQMPGEARRFRHPRFSPNGRQIVVEVQDGVGIGNAAGTDLWLIDRVTGEPTRVTRSGVARTPEWMPDGRSLLYIQRGADGRGVWTTPLDASTKPMPLDIRDGVESAVPTPDNQSVVVMLQTAPGRDLIRVALGGRTQIDTLESERRTNGIRAISPRVSPDGRLVAFGERNGLNVNVRRLDGIGQLQISTGRGCCPVWAPDSRRVYYSADNSPVWVDLATSPTLAVTRRGTRADLGKVAGGEWFNGDDYDLSRDGRTFVALEPVGPTSRLVMAIGWATELRREVRAGNAEAK